MTPGCVKREHAGGRGGLLKLGRGSSAAVLDVGGRVMAKVFSTKYPEGI